MPTLDLTVEGPLNNIFICADYQKVTQICTENSHLHFVIPFEIAAKLEKSYESVNHKGAVTMDSKFEENAKS